MNFTELEQACAESATSKTKTNYNRDRFEKAIENLMQQMFSAIGGTSYEKSVSGLIIAHAKPGSFAIAVRQIGFIDAAIREMLYESCSDMSNYFQQRITVELPIVDITSSFKFATDAVDEECPGQFRLIVCSLSQLNKPSMPSGGTVTNAVPQQFFDPAGAGMYVPINGIQRAGGYPPGAYGMYPGNQPQNQCPTRNDVFESSYPSCRLDQNFLFFVLRYRTKNGAFRGIPLSLLPSGLELLSVEDACHYSKKASGEEPKQDIRVEEPAAHPNEREG